MQKHQASQRQTLVQCISHNATHTTYVTEQNIILDDIDEDIIHPMVPLLFTTLKNGIYSKSSNWVDEKPIIPNEIGMA